MIQLCKYQSSTMMTMSYEYEDTILFLIFSNNNTTTTS